MASRSSQRTLAKEKKHVHFSTQAPAVPILAVVIAFEHDGSPRPIEKTSSFGDTDLNITVSDADRSSAADALRDYKHPVTPGHPLERQRARNEAASRSRFRHRHSGGCDRWR